SGDAARRVDGYLSRLVPYGFSGAVLIAKDSAIVLEKGYGLADRAAGRPYTPDLVSCIGSVTKQFTGAAIVKLETEGKLLTSDPIAKYLPGVPADKAAITIHHLLTHTAGFSGDLGGSDEEPIARDALVAKVLAAPLASAPGARFEYSNEGYALAGAIIERVSGQGYEPYLREHLFLPAGMHDTGYLIPEWPLDRLPKGYGDDQTEWGRVYKRGWLPDGPGWYLRANGGIHSSLDDLYKWHLALESGKVLSKGATKKYLTGYVASLGGGERYAYGWGVRKTARGTTVISHNGGNGFFFTDFRRYADEKVVIIAMSNQPVISATELAPGQIESLFFGGAPVITPPVAVSVPRARRDAIAGTYALANGATITLRATEAGLEAESSDPFIFRASTIRRASATLTDLEARTLSLVEEAAKGNYRPLFEAFDDERPFEVVQGNQTKYWAGWRAQYGEFQKAEVLGTGRAQGDPAVQVRLRFARGGPILQFVWGPRRLAGWRAMPGAEAVPLAAQSPDTWIYYSYREPHLVQLSFTTDGSLVIARGDSTITGRKS
ncbi:MAG TPA: serine hydrolase domain-containing protein, partial [Vicinamibacterales bacterium]|nr:serine hydrolase domain-containing protein [Vicinamibacterales bacterium]